MPEERDPRIEKIIQSLFRRTKQGSISWEAHLPGRGREILMCSTTAASIELWAKDDDGQHPFVFRILDENGIELDRVVTEPFSEDGDVIQHLYIAARKNALDIDGKLDSMLAELDQE